MLLDSLPCHTITILPMSSTMASSSIVIHLVILHQRTILIFYVGYSQDHCTHYLLMLLRWHLLGKVLLVQDLAAVELLHMILLHHILSYSICHNGPHCHQLNFGIMLCRILSFFMRLHGG